ncbi:MAG TPA: hypothetical protein VNW95_14315 [Mucilaginibacter sp.]|nr:hypothetical protein [Mucilaginibacter sp.]
MKTLKVKGIVAFLLLCLAVKTSIAQETQPPSNYPRVTGFFAVLVPVGTFNSNGFTANFSKSTALGMPFGFNLLKSDHLGFSMEMVPFMLSQNGSTKMNYMLFHPGVMFRFPHGFTITPRLAFQTDGRYGFTPVFGKIISVQKDYQLYISLSEPVRYGSNLPGSYTTAVQFGISF